MESRRLKLKCNRTFRERERERERERVLPLDLGRTGYEWRRVSAPIEVGRPISCFQVPTKRGKGSKMSKEKENK